MLLDFHGASLCLHQQTVPGVAGFSSICASIPAIMPGFLLFQVERGSIRSQQPHRFHANSESLQISLSMSLSACSCLCRLICASLIIMLLLFFHLFRPSSSTSSSPVFSFSFPDNLPRKITAIGLIWRRSCIFTHLFGSSPQREISVFSNLNSSSSSLTTPRSLIFFFFSTFYCFRFPLFKPFTSLLILLVFRNCIDALSCFIVITPVIVTLWEFDQFASFVVRVWSIRKLCSSSAKQRSYARRKITFSISKMMKI